MNLRQISSLREMPVVDLESGDLLGHIDGWVISPRDQRVAAWRLKKTRLWQTMPVIITADIAEYGPRMVVARTRDTIIAPSEVVGLPELIAQKMSVVGFEAKTVTGQVLGRVNDLVFDTVTSSIQQYYIRPKTLAGLWQTDLVLPASKVVTITAGQVLFSDNTTPVAMTAPKEQTQTA